MFKLVHYIYVDVRKETVTVYFKRNANCIKYL